MSVLCSANVLPWLLSGRCGFNELRPPSESMAATYYKPRALPVVLNSWLLQRGNFVVNTLMVRLCYLNDDSTHGWNSQTPNKYCGEAGSVCDMPFDTWLFNWMDVMLSRPTPFDCNPTKYESWSKWWRCLETRTITAAHIITHIARLLHNASTENPIKPKQKTTRAI